MAIVNCPECKKEISDTVKKCPHCGYKMTIKNGHRKKIILTVIIVLLIGGCGSGITYFILNHDPVAKYQRLVSNGKKQEAVELYSSKIKNNTNLNAELEEQEKKKMDMIYSDFLGGKMSYDDASKEINVYKQYDSSQKYADEISIKVNKLSDSRNAFDSARKFEENNEYVKAIQEYSNVIEEDPNYEAASQKTISLKETYKKQLLEEADGYAKEKKYSKAISSIETAIDYIGEDKDLVTLRKKYKKAKDEMYVKVVLKNKTVTPKDSDNWIFSNYVNFVFDVKNNSNKSIKGVQGKAIFKDQFGEEIKTIGCDFNGHTIKPGKTLKVSDLCLECNEFLDDDMELYSTKYKDLKFEYKVTKIVFSDGKSVKPE